MLLRSQRRWERKDGRWGVDYVRLLYGVSLLAIVLHGWLPSAPSGRGRMFDIEVRDLYS